jgi:hypothetical protein
MIRGNFNDIGLFLKIEEQGGIVKMRGKKYNTFD